MAHCLLRFSNNCCSRIKVKTVFGKLDELVTTNKVQERTKIMGKWEASTKENEIIFMSNICMIVSGYAEDNNIRPSHLADELYEYFNRLEECKIPVGEGITAHSTDDEDVFVQKIAISLMVYSAANDVDLMFLVKGVWYALTKAEQEDLFNV